VNIQADLYVLLPELILAVGAMALLLIGAVRGDKSANTLTILSVVLIAVSAWLSMVIGDGTAFHGAFVMDSFARFTKAVILWSSAACVLMAHQFFALEKSERFELPVLIVLASLGMSLMVSANNFIALYMGLELQSLALYVLAAFNRQSVRSSEAGLKYFVLGSLSSGMMLYGISMIYGFTGSMDFAGVAHVVKAGSVTIGVIFGIVFLLAGLAFKISAVPFHMWTPDVYEGSPTPITAFLATASKVASLALVLRAVVVPFPAAFHQWQQVIIAISVLSMGLGAFAAIGQGNIKRLMAYSSIGHMGYALLGLAAGTELGLRGVLFYLAFYSLTNVGVFACIQAMRRGGQAVENISDLAGLARTKPMRLLSSA
jgi:NADH-quinone oxidoreductase subunit N